MTEQDKQKGLWRNCEDSIRHALEHFSAGASENELFHHHRWALLSVENAAEVYGNLLLCVFNPEHPNNGWYPSLKCVRKALKNHPCLSPSECRFFEEVPETLAAQPEHSDAQAGSREPRGAGHRGCGDSALVTTSHRPAANGSSNRGVLRSRSVGGTGRPRSHRRSRALVQGGGSTCDIRVRRRILARMQPLRLIRGAA